MKTTNLPTNLVVTWKHTRNLSCRVGDEVGTSHFTYCSITDITGDAVSVGVYISPVNTEFHKKYANQESFKLAVSDITTKSVRKALWDAYWKARGHVPNIGEVHTYKGKSYTKIGVSQIKLNAILHKIADLIGRKNFITKEEFETIEGKWIPTVNYSSHEDGKTYTREENQFNIMFKLKEDADQDKS